MLKEIYKIMYYSYSRYYPDDTLRIKSSAILFVAMIRISLFSPVLGFLGALTDYKYKYIIIGLYTLVCIFISIKSSPKSVNTDLIKKKFRGLYKVYPYIILVLSIIWGVIGSVLGSKYIVKPYGLEGWLLHF